MSPIDLLDDVILIQYRLSTDDSTAYINIDGVDVDDIPYVSPLSSTVSLKVAANRANTEQLGCDIYEILIFNRELTGPEITQTERYLSNKWGLSL